MALGKIDSIFRYPVKSMMGEKIEETQVTLNGVLGDQNQQVARIRCKTLRGGIEISPKPEETHRLLLAQKSDVRKSN